VAALARQLGGGEPRYEAGPGGRGTRATLRFALLG
jgi:hypothetical protein